MWTDDEAGGNIGKQRERQHLEHDGIPSIGNEDFQSQDANGKGSEQNEEGCHGYEQLNGRRHCAQIGADVEDIGYKHQADCRYQYRATVLLPNDRGNARAGNQADASAHLLHRNQKRKHVQRQPELAGAEGGAGLGIGADARRIIVGCASDQSRPQDAQPPLNVQ